MDRTISVIGLGYVGLPVAVAFAGRYQVIGFDISKQRVVDLQRRFDRTLEVSSEALAKAKIHFSSDPTDLALANFHIVAVPTPITDSKQPDLGPLLRATETVGRQLKRGDIVVYESTVYPGATEDECLPILERESGLQSGVDFTVGYSPERINPGDRQHGFTQITKVVAGQNQATLDAIAEVYGSVITAGIHKAPSIKAAEAAKVIENTQRDLNIALMNELAIIFKRMNIDTLDVLEAASTKWNFLPFRPGLVGGHCIGVDPYYLTYKAQQVGYHPDVILAGRRTNDGMGRYIVSEAIKQLLLHGVSVNNAKIAVLGLTFKEDCPDLRNSRVVDIIRELKTYNVQLLVHDPLANRDEARRECQVELCEWSDLNDLDAIIITTAHRHYRELAVSSFREKLNSPGLLFDVKGIIDRHAAAALDLPLWRL